MGSLCEANPDVRLLRTKVIENCEDFVTICEKTNANGEGAETSTEGYESYT